MSKPYINSAEIEKAKRIDPLTYLQQCEPGDLIGYGANSYTTKTHDSLKISNGRGYWWLNGVGGRRTLEYLTKSKACIFSMQLPRLA